jgi:hypothetical protein
MKIMQNKRGLSTVVVTLIIIVLSLAAIVIVWVVVNNLLKNGTAGVDINSKCLGINLQITQANCSAGTTNKICDIQVARSGTTAEVFSGVKLVFRNVVSGINSPAAIDVPGDIPIIVGARLKAQDTGIAKSNAIDTVEITPYFKDASGNVQLCAQTNPFKFVG